MGRAHGSCTSTGKVRVAVQADRHVQLAVECEPLLFSPHPFSFLIKSHAKKTNTADVYMGSVLI
jgi:hypothetical protein